MTWATLRTDTGLTLRPIDRWPQAWTRDRQAARFRSTLTKTLTELRRELVSISARSVVVQLAFRERDLRMDGLPRADARMEHPGVILSFETRSLGALSYPCDTYTDWQANLRAIVLSLEALRAVDRYGVTRRGEQYRGFAAISAPEPDADPVVRAHDVLAKYGGERQALLSTHPDHGGDREEFERVQQARRDLGLAR